MLYKTIILTSSETAVKCFQTLLAAILSFSSKKAQYVPALAFDMPTGPAGNLDAMAFS
jgi:hypothetical protein